MSHFAAFNRQYRFAWFLLVLVAIATVLGAMLIPQDSRIRAEVARVSGNVKLLDLPTQQKAGTAMLLPSIDELGDLFASVGYHLDDVRSGSVTVPRLTLAALPPDMAQIDLPDKRKEMFLRYMLPLVLEANQNVRRQRKQLLDIQRYLNRNAEISTNLWQWFLELAKEYHVEPKEIDELVRRVDVVPPSLALAQAAIESGWGTSRFALEGNSAFGQWTTYEYRGLVPLRRPDGQTYKIRSFERPIDAVNSYLRNLNTHRAYDEFRLKREALSETEGTVDSLKLVNTLEVYSEEGSKYLQLLRQVIIANSLRTLDGARLGKEVLNFGPDA